jgi:MFS family permease
MFDWYSVGQASDKYGRKPIILLAMTCAMVSSLLFGFSTSLRWAVAARAFSGASNGNVGILRTTVAEMVPQKVLQPKAFAVLPLVWSIGSIVGPILGGALASPATKLPHMFGSNKFFKKFPFALPNLVNGVIFTFGLLVGVLFLKESLEAKKYRRDYGRIVGKWLTRSCTGRRKELRPADDFESMLPSGKSRKAKPPTYAELFHKQTNLTLLAYAILALHGIAYDQLLPVMMHLPVKRDNVKLPLKFSTGFGIDSGRIGLLFMVYGGIGMLGQFLVFPPATQRYGALKCMRACTLLMPLIYVLTPYVVLMPTSITQQAAVLVIMFFKSMTNVFAYPCITILLTNSARSLQILGTLNGVATSLAAIGRALGPYIAGRAFTWGVNSGYLVSAFWLLAIFAVPGHLVTWWLTEGKGFGEDDEEEKPTEEIGDETGEDVGLEATRRTLTVDATAAAFEESDKEDGDSDVEDAPLLTAKQKDWKV